MDAGAIGRQLQEFDRYIESLQLRVRGKAHPRDVADEALEGLYTALEELRVGEEELRLQNEQLQQTTAQVEAERLRYRQLFDLAPDAYLVTDTAGVVLEANAAAGRLTGVSRGRMARKPVTVFIDPPSRRAFRLELARRTRGDADREWEFVVRSRSGARIPVACTTVGRIDEETGAPVLQWLLRDISERKAAEQRELQLEREHAQGEAAEKARRQLDAVIRHLAVGVVIAEAPSGRLITYNPAAEALLGEALPLAESAEQYSKLYQGFHLDGREYAPAEWPMARAVRAGEVVIGEEVEIVRRDGSRRVLVQSAAPVRDPEGRIVAGVASLHDITEEKRQAEIQRFLGEVSDALATSLDYEATVQRIAALACTALADYATVFVQEDDGRIAGLGYAAADPEEEGELREIMRGASRDADPDHPIVAAMRAGGPVLAPEITGDLMRHLLGEPEGPRATPRLELGSLLILPLSVAGRTLGAIALARRANAPPFEQEELALGRELAARAAHAVDNARLYLGAQRAARLQEETISIVSHDLRNALNAALTNADLLLDITPAFEGRPRERRQMEAVRRSLDHMQRLVQDLLEVDRIDRGRLSIHPQPLAPHTLVEELNGWLAPVVRDAGLHWEIDIPLEVRPILADHARVVQVLANLVGNAVGATAQGGRVSIRAENAGSEVRFHVSDTGAGIDPESLPRIFDRFFQVPTRGKTGSGLGLTISRGLVEAHGGRMWAESRVGEGSTFTFSLPLAT